MKREKKRKFKWIVVIISNHFSIWCHVCVFSCDSIENAQTLNWNRIGMEWNGRMNISATRKGFSKSEKIRLLCYLFFFVRRPEEKQRTIERNEKLINEWSDLHASSAHVQIILYLRLKIVFKIETELHHIKSQWNASSYSMGFDVPTSNV